MPNQDAMAGLKQALAAIDLMLRNGRLPSGRLPELARDARRAAENLVPRRRLAPVRGRVVDRVG